MYYYTESLKKLMTVRLHRYTHTHTMFLSHIKKPKLCVCCKGREPEFCYRFIPLQGDEVYKMKAQ